MSPDLKKALVEEFSAMHYTVGMCGDGANDCGSLRQADVGLSLADTEASVAAPFSSKVQNITAQVQLIRHGRCALATSVACFKYMALYGMIQATSAVMLYNLGSNLGDFQYLFIDLFLVLPTSAAMAFMKPKTTIKTAKPLSNLVSLPVIVSLVINILLQGLAQGIMYTSLQAQDWYSPLIPDPEDSNFVCQENTTVYLISLYCYINCGIIFSMERNFRKPLFKNGWYIGVLAWTLGFSLYMTFTRDQWIVDIMVLDEVPDIWRGAIFIGAIIHFVLCVLGEFLVTPLFCWCCKQVEDRVRKDKGLKKYYERLLANEIEVKDIPMVAINA
jgi:cation-transporting ATPase 13A3/4/5